MRPLSALILLLLSGCVTVVVPSDERDPSALSRRALVRGQRAAEEQQAELRSQSLGALTTTAVRIASDLQAWALKPVAFGGGDDDLDGVTFEHLGYPADGGRYHTPDGGFWLARDSVAVLVHGESPVFGHGVTARVAGVSWRDVSLTVRPQLPHQG